MRRAFFILAAAAGLGACAPEGQTTEDTMPAATPTPPPAPAPDSPEGKIAQAESAAPAGIASAATIMDWPASEGAQPTVLRQGTNGWACFPATPQAQASGDEDPMCLDPNFQQWAEAWIAKTPPSISGTGFGYMLRGDFGASATDPFAMSETPDNNWVRTGPHVMVVVPDPAMIDALPTEPGGGGPWVMWKGTPWAHVMMPVPGT